eukprot:scaffold72284_cov19-Tisochrysis_lutea.AAC.1
MAMAAYECTTLYSEPSRATSRGNTASRVSLGSSDLRANACTWCVKMSICVCMFARMCGELEALGLRPLNLNPRASQGL